MVLNWLIALSVVAGLGWGAYHYSPALLEPGASAAEQNQLVQTQRRSTSPQGAIDSDIPWGASPSEVIQAFGPPDVSEEGILAYQLPGNDQPTLLGYHFDEADTLFGVSIVYPRPTSQQEETEQFLTLVSEFGEPDGYREPSEEPVWVLDNGTLLTLINGDDMQAILLLRAPEGVPNAPQPRMIQDRVPDVI